MRLATLFTIISTMAFSLQSYAKTVHLVSGTTSSRTHLDLHPVQQTATINIEYTGCDKSFNPEQDKKNIVFYKPNCIEDKSSNPSSIKGNTLGLKVDYKNKAAPETCKKEDMATKRITIKEVLKKPVYQKAIAECGALNITISSATELAKITDDKAKRKYQLKSARALGTAQACDSLDRLKKIKFGDNNGISPGKSKDPILQKGIYVRNGGFRIGNHTYAEYNDKKIPVVLKNNSTSDS